MMGTKRDPSSPLEKLEATKRQNTEQHQDRPQSVEGTLNPDGDLDRLKQEMVNRMDQLKEDLCGEIATASQKVGEELRDEIAMVSKKIGEICLSHGSVLKSLQFHSDYLETLNDKAAKLDLVAQASVVRMDKMGHQIRDQGNKIIRVDQEVLDHG